jgi:uncharacterized protein (DUF885 family)
VDRRLDELCQRYWDTEMEWNPVGATLLGDHRFDDRLPDLTITAAEAQRRDLLLLHDEVTDVATESIDDDLTKAMLLHELHTDSEMIDIDLVVAPCDPMIGPHSTLLRAAALTSVTEPAQAEMLLTRYAGVPELLAQAADRHRHQLATGKTPVEVNVRRVLNQLGQYLSSPVDSDPFTGATLPSDWDGAEGWRSRVGELVEDVIRPGFARYREMIADEILPATRSAERPGLTHLEGGDDAYRRLAAVFTSLPTPPEEIHRIGTEIATDHLPDEYAEVGKRAIDETNLDSILRRLRDDPALRFTTAAEIVDAAEEVIARAIEEAPRWFGVLPEAGCAVMPVPETLAADMPPAYYYPPATDGSRPGTYFINTHEPGTRARFEAESVAFHEAVPGHHFQVALAAEMGDLPKFRRHALVIPFAEGWGLYAERLADEMGLYSTDLDRLGMLSADSWRAGRLVVDTGIHALGWTRQRAVDFLTSWSAVAPSVIEVEVDRYIGVPGQALAYKMGQLEINRLRGDAEQRLGSRFDLSGFHDTVLTSGPVTLGILGEQVRRWVDSR